MAHAQSVRQQPTVFDVNEDEYNGAEDEIERRFDD